MNREFRRGDLARHFKYETINELEKQVHKYIYRIIGVATDETTNESFMIYQAMYDNHGVYMRPLEMFLSEVDHVKYPNIKQKYRLEKITLFDLPMDTNFPKLSENTYTKWTAQHTETKEKYVICQVGDKLVVSGLDTNN